MNHDEILRVEIEKLHPTKGQRTYHADNKIFVRSDIAISAMQQARLNAFREIRSHLMTYPRITQASIINDFKDNIPDFSEAIKEGESLPMEQNSLSINCKVLLKDGRVLTVKSLEFDSIVSFEEVGYIPKKFIKEILSPKPNKEGGEG